MPAGQVALLGAIAGLTIFLGLPFGRLRRQRPAMKSALSGIAIGILIFLEWDILTHAWEPIETALADHAWGFSVSGLALLAAGLAAGLIGLVQFDGYMANHQRRQRAPASGTSPLSGGLPARSGTKLLVDARPALTATPGADLAAVIAVGIGLHNFAEGLAIGNSAASGDLSLALLLVIGFGLHNATEGFGIVAPMSGGETRPSWRLLAALGLIAGAPTFLGTLIGQQVVSDLVSIGFLAIAAGSVLYVVIELLAVARRSGFKQLTAWTILAGALLGFLTDAILVIAGA